MPKVLKTFKCLQEGKKYFPGDNYSGKRLKEFQESGLVGKSAAKKTKTKNGKPKTEDK